MRAGDAASAQPAKPEVVDDRWTSMDWWNLASFCLGMLQRNVQTLQVAEVALDFARSALHGSMMAVGLPSGLLGPRLTEPTDGRSDPRALHAPVWKGIGASRGDGISSDDPLPPAPSRAPGDASARPAPPPTGES